MRAIESCLTQTYSNIEIIVVDDNSPNDVERELTKKVMMQYTDSTKVSYIQHTENRNGAVARNTGIRHARGDYIAFLDDDDYYLPQRVETSVTYLESNTSYGGIIVGVQINRKDGTVLSLLIPKQDLTVRHLLLYEWIIGTGSNIFVRKDVIDSINGFDEAFIRRQDIEFMIRICKKTKIGFSQNVLVVKDNNGISNIPSYEKMVGVLAQFDKKFEDDINDLSPEDKKTFEVTEAQTLFNTAVSSRNYKVIAAATRNLESHKKLTLKERLIVILCRFKIFDTAIVRKISRVSHKLPFINSI